MAEYFVAHLRSAFNIVAFLDFMFSEDSGFIATCLTVFGWPCHRSVLFMVTFSQWTTVGGSQKGNKIYLTIA